MVTIDTIREESYSVTVGLNLWNKVNTFLQANYPSDKAILVVDENVKEHHGMDIALNVEHSFNSIVEYVVPSGESSKSTREWGSMIDFVLENGVRRNTPLLAFGGGVTGDLSGYVASSVLRGIPLIQFPTTLLAMVDSSIGGKTGLDHYTGKNLIGSFYQPDAVFADLTFLNSLPRKEWLCGMGEVIKYAAIADEKIFEQSYSYLNENEFENVQNWTGLIERCADIKGTIVCKDEKESGIRAYLNFGHTFAHAIETYLNYNSISHGEAVYAGMIAASYLSNKVGANLDLDRILQFKPFYNLDLSSIFGKSEELIEIMYRDKKVKSDKLRFVLLKNWENPYTLEIENVSLIKEAWNFLFDVYQSS